MGRKATGGVEVHGNTLRVYFQYQGKRCREVLTDVPPTLKNKAAAQKDLVTMLEKIKHGVFDYLEYFPNSKIALGLARERGAYTMVGEYLDAFMRINGPSLADATRSQYANDVIMWKGLLGENTPVARLSTTGVLEIVNSRPWPSNRRFNNAMTPLRGALKLARADNAKLPDWLFNLKMRQREKVNPDPVTMDEMNRILRWIRANRDPRCLAYFAFMFSTGMRPEECVALLWSDVDFSSRRVSVNKAKSFRGRAGPTKTEGGVRDVDLSPLAMEALEVMKPWTRHEGAEIFQNPWTNKAWYDGRSPRENVWQPCLKALRIAPRRAYCTRHTFATSLLRVGARVHYVSAQLGHTTPSMVEKTYARWLPDADGGFGRARLAEAFGAGTSGDDATVCRLEGAVNERAAV